MAEIHHRRRLRRRDARRKIGRKRHRFARLLALVDQLLFVLEKLLDGLGFRLARMPAKRQPIGGIDLRFDVFWIGLDRATRQRLRPLQRQLGRSSASAPAAGVVVLYLRAQVSCVSGMSKASNIGYRTLRRTKT